MNNEQGKTNKMKNAPFLKLFNKLFELKRKGILSFAEILLCSLIHSWHMNSNQSCCNISNPVLAKTLGVTMDTISKCINGEPSRNKPGLVKLGLIVYKGQASARVLLSNLSEELMDTILANTPNDKSGGTPNDYSGGSGQLSSTPNDKSGGTPNDKSDTPKGYSSTPPGKTLPYNNNKTDLKNNSKKYINVKLEGKSELKFSKLKKDKQIDITIILDFWNSYKSKGTWKSHMKYSPDMIDAIMDTLKSYTVEEICQAINNYALVLQNDKYYWDYPWPLSIFLTVKTGKCKDDPKKWWRFLEENFIEETYLSRYNNGNSSSSPKQDELPHDPDPELTELVIETYRKVYRPRGEFPNQTALRHFRLISTKAKKTYKLDSTSSKKTFVEEFFQIAHDTWSSKGEEVMPWDLSGSMMWDYKIPQYYQNMGVPEALIGEVNGG